MRSLRSDRDLGEAWRPILFFTLGGVAFPGLAVQRWNESPGVSLFVGLVGICCWVGLWLTITEPNHPG